MTLDDRELDRRLAALARQAPVEDESWRRIERRIRPRWRLPAAAAAALVLAFSAVLVLQPLPDERGADEMQTLVAAEVRAMRASAPAEPVLSRLDSPQALMQAWQENQNAIAELEQALERDPGNGLLLEFLAEARLRQAQLIHSGLTLSPQQRMTL